LVLYVLSASEVRASRYRFSWLLPALRNLLCIDALPWGTYTNFY